jgi:hypothetical protein
MIVLIPVSWVARIMDVSHQCRLILLFILFIFLLFYGPFMAFYLTLPLNYHPFAQEANVFTGEGRSTLTCSFWDVPCRVPHTGTRLRLRTKREVSVTRRCRLGRKSSHCVMGLFPIHEAHSKRVKGDRVSARTWLQELLPDLDVTICF